MATYVSLVVGNGKKRKQNYFNIRRKKKCKTRQTDKVQRLVEIAFEPIALRSNDFL